ncbi:Basic helix-loop-helix transcription factor scleraxis [Merluccius polli]|uniref:Basic helix-loop-helix transcription factor scleraxis n=1 Tax=Merluccius polli TaxID=89951 RepID=A0AA47PCJ3_MERPO|nr:Basic helix-loop-helix transcription factor scleraxis [Merluccius polli]
MTFAMLRAAPPAGRYLYSDIALLSEDDDDNGSEGSGSEERGALNTTTSSSFRISSSSSSPSAFHIKVNRKRKLSGGGGVGGGGGGLGIGLGGGDDGGLLRLGPPGSSPGAPGEFRQRNAANARERDRTNSVNTAFTALRTLIPTEPADRYEAAASRKISRRDTCVLLQGQIGAFKLGVTSNRHENAYCRLHVKLSKIETLRLASSYISHLGNVLLLGEGLHDGQPCHGPSPPFFHLSSSPTRVSDQSAQPKHICTFCLSNQRKMVRA